MTNADGSERDTMGVGQPDDSELAEKELGEQASSSKTDVREEVPEEDRAEDELEPLEGGAETMADLEEEGGQANRPGTDRPPV